jgi:hypothetical protein
MLHMHNKTFTKAASGKALCLMFPFRASSAATKEIGPEKLVHEEKGQACAFWGLIPAFATLVGG